MSAIQEQILNAVSLLANSAVSQSNATITIECEVLELLDPALGSYKVKYLENMFTVYSNTSSVYQPGDIVFVLVPDRDLTKTKTIIGAVAPNASMYITSEPTDSYVAISDNLFTSVEDIELCTYNSKTYNVSLDTTNFAMIFQDYLENYRNFVFTARIKTDIDLEQQQGGNYGVILNLPFIEDAGDGVSSNQTYKAVSLDVNTIQGNPYRLDEYSLQNIYFEIAEGAQYDSSRDPYLTVFVQDFAQNASITAADIFIKDIGLKVVDVLSEEDKTGYSLTLVASEGNYFLNSKYSTSKTLSPILKVNGKTKKVDNYECYWFVEDSSININSDGYSTLGGLGWKCLNKKTNVHYNEEGKMTYQYVNNSYTLTVSQSDVVSSLKYKCVLVKDSIVVGGNVCLKNLNNKIEIQLVSATGSASFVKDTGYANLIARIYYPGVSDNSSSAISIDTAWQRFDKNGNYLDDNFFEYVRINDVVTIADATGTVKKWLETEIKYPCSLIEESNMVNCSFYSITTKDGAIAKNNLGTASLIINTSDDYVYKIVIQNGDVLYKYDADGDSPMIADYDGPASSKVTEIQPLSYRVFKVDGTEFSDIEYQYCKAEWKIPKNSMIKLKTTATREDDNYSYVEGRGQVNVNYTIIDTYNVKKSDNGIILTVNFRDNVITETANIKFLKDGESGTNGSKYAGMITYQGYGYGEINSAGKPHKLQPVLVNGAWRLCDSITGSVVSWSNPRLDVSVYCDGDLMTSGYSVTWRIFDSTVTNPLFTVSNGVLAPKGISWSNATSTIVEAEIKVGNAGVTNSQEVIYAYYPIEITYLPAAAYANGIVPNLIDGFTEVLYAADGTNPKYDNTNPFAYADNLQDADASGYYNYIWSIGGNLEIKKTENNLCTVKPLTKFDNGNSLNYVNVAIQITASGRSQVNNLISTLSAKASSLANEISYNQYTLQHILAFSQKFSYNNYVGLLDKSKDLLLYRANLLYYIDQLLTILDDLKGYCQLKEIQISDFDYNSIYNVRNNLLNTEKNNLYKLGYYTGLGDLNRLDSILISLNNVEISTIKNRYGISVYAVLTGYIDKFNRLVENKYWDSYDILCSKRNNVFVLKSQFDNFKMLETNIISLTNDSDLNWLQTAHYGFGPEQEFINLRSQLLAISHKFFDTLSYCYSYDAIKQEILNEFQKLIVKYQNDYYKTNYNNKIAALQVELDQVNVDLSDYRKVITSQTSGVIRHSKPIIMSMNRYELSNINGWDGNKLYIDNTNNEYLLAPQVGAGAKTNGLFTGVIMGVKQFNAKSLQHIGLFGYSSGVQSYFMNAEDGSVIMGKTGSGQLIADPSQSKALLYSSNFFSSYNNDGKPTSYGTTNWAKKGMLIDLTTPQIQFGSGKFSVSEEGEIKSTAGYIGGWRITDTQIYSDVTANNGRLTLDSGATVTGQDAKGNNIYSYSYGKIYTGNHNALSSTRKGFYLSQEGLSISDEGSSNRIELNATGNPKIYSGGHNSVDSPAKGFYLSQDGFSICNGTRSRIELNTGGDPKIFSNSKSTLGNPTPGFYLGNDGLSIGSKVYIDDDGVMRLGRGAVAGGSGAYWEVDANNGSETASHIAYGSNKTFASSDLNNVDNYNIGGGSSQVYIGTNGIRLGNKFAVDNSGNLVAKHLIARDGGNIGGWTIEKSQLKASNILIKSNGSIETASYDSSDKGWKISSTGDAYFKSIYADKSGSIAGWTIDGNQLKSPSNSMLIKSEGSLYGPDDAWYINKSGNAKFDNIKCQSVWEFGANNNTWTSTNGFSFNDGSLGGNSVALAKEGGLAFTQGSMAMGDPKSGADVQGIKIGQNGSSVSIAGTIYANAGVIGGCEIKNNILKVESANIESLSVDKITDGNGKNASTTKTIKWQSMKSIEGISITIQCFTASIASKWNKETGEPIEYKKYWVAGRDSEKGSASDIITSFKYKTKSAYVLTGLDDNATDNDGSVS